MLMNVVGVFPLSYSLETSVAGEQYQRRHTVKKRSEILKCDYGEHGDNGSECDKIE
jgi:hypothetical protein